MPAYFKTVDEIYDLQQFAIKLGLDNITKLCDFLGQPHTKFPAIHLAGTNGKGSTAFFLSKFLQASGLKVGLFTSPHLSDFRERIRVDGIKITQKYVTDYWTKVKGKVLDQKATFFDTTTAMAFAYFADQKVNVAVIETGLGGRLDSTNIIEPKHIVLTPIQKDHQKQLGNTISQIAYEKAGIIKKDAAVFSAKQNPEALSVLKESLHNSNRFFYLPDHVIIDPIQNTLEGSIFNLEDIIHRIRFESLHCKQIGSFQLENIALAYLTARIYLRESRVVFDETRFRKILCDIIWPGRMQVIQKNPTILMDVSHNLTGIEHTVKSLGKLINTNKLHILLGLVEDKDYLKIARLIAGYSIRIVITEPATHRKLSGEVLMDAFSKIQKKVNLIKDFRQAYEFSKKQLQGDDNLLVIGSHYLIGPLMNKGK